MVLLARLHYLRVLQAQHRLELVTEKVDSMINDAVNEVQRTTSATNPAQQTNEGTLYHSQGEMQPLQGSLVPRKLSIPDHEPA